MNIGKIVGILSLGNRRAKQAAAQSAKKASMSEITTDLEKPMGSKGQVTNLMIAAALCDCDVTPARHLLN